MSSTVSLSGQIEEVQYELGQRKGVYDRIASSNPRRRSELELHTARMEAVLRTLQWLADNEAKIKAKIEAAETITAPAPIAAPEQSNRVLHQRCVAFLDYAKGGWSHVYEILDDGKVIGGKTVSAETRAAQPVSAYRLGDQTFNTAAEFFAAYEATLAPSGQEGEAA